MTPPTTTNPAIGNRIQVRKLHRSALVQKLLLLSDFLLTLLSESQRHTFFIVAGCYGFQLVLLSANVIQLILLFTNTYAFRAGMVGVMVREFRGTVSVYAVYALLFLVTRGMGGVSYCDSFNLYKKINDGWL